MKRILIGLLLLGTLGICTEVSAQAQDYASLPRAEKRAWKRELRRLKVEAYFDMKQSMESMSTDLQSLRATVAGKDQQITTLIQEKSGQQDRIASLEAQLAEAQQELASRPAEPVQPENVDNNEPLSAGTRVTKGVIFRVQIGAFRQKDLSKYFDNHPNFAVEIAEGGTQQITLGQFRDYWEADVFKKYLREMGVNDAWIVPYQDGQRVSLKDVLEGVIR